MCPAICHILGFVKVKPMKLRSELPLALKSVFKNVGVLNVIACDGEPDQVEGSHQSYDNKILVISNN